MKTLCALVASLLLGAVAVAAPPLPIAADARLEPGKSQTLTVDVPAEALTRKVALSFLARLDHPGLGGSTFSLQVFLNGKNLERDRLLNKPPETEMLNGLLLDWFGQGGWRIAYSPDYEAANKGDSPMALIGGHAYDFVLEVSDLLKAGPNEIVLRHNEPTIPNVLLVKDLALVDAPPRVASLEPPEDPRAPLRPFAPTNRTRVAYQCAPGRDVLNLTVGKLKLRVTSAFQHPQATPDALARERRVQQYPDHVAISDKLTNLTDQDLHVGLRYMIDTSGLTGGEAYLRGLKSRIMEGYEKGGDNPTVFVKSGSDGLGIVAEDDVLRAQCAQSATRTPAEAGLVDNLFMLEPHATYEIRWSLYPTPNGDYFDFVNAVRRNWGTNFTIPGPFTFAPHPTSEALVPDWKSWLGLQNIRIVSLQIPMPRPAELSHGLAFLQEPEEQQRLKAQAARIRAARPGVKVLQYLHVYITRMDSAVDAYADARHLGPDGKQLSYAAGSWKPTFWLFLPTTTNAYGREMNKTFDLVCDQLGFDGVYWDELAYSANEVAYKISDGHSGMPDMQKLTVRERVAMTPLYCQSYQVQQAKRVLNAGKMLIGNGQPVTETMTKLHFPRFVEAWHPSALRTAQLYCPLGLSSPDRVQTEEDIVPSVRGQLQYGGLWYIYCGWQRMKLTHPTITDHMFPFTPIELHQGYVIGQERILTAKSGLFGWGDKSKHAVFVYGADGKLLANLKAPLQTIKGATYSAVRLPPGAVAAIERVK